MNSIHPVQLTDSVPGPAAAGPDRFLVGRAVEYGPLSAALAAAGRKDRAVPATDGNPEEALTLSENFNAEIDAWARQALCRNGFGDF